MWLAHKLFGNGRGLKSPYWNDTYYWLSGRMYHQTGWIGCQLQSFEFFQPPVGERRRLVGREFRLTNAKRRFLLVQCSWCMVDDITNESVRALIDDLKEMRFDR